MSAATPDQQRHACERCRKSKLRCLVDTVKRHGKCRRCHDADVECVFESMAPRQKRKRIDTRLAALEKQVAKLQAAADASGDSSTSVAGHLLTPSTGTSHSASITTFSQDHLLAPLELSDGDTIPGILAADTVSLALAFELLSIFVQHALPEYPVIGLPNNVIFEDLRVKKPTLLFAMITAGARGTYPLVFGSLHDALCRHLSEWVIIKGARSVEMLQAVIVAEVWYNPPEDLKNLNFYMWIQIAATMATQLGLWWNDRSLARVQDGSASSDDIEMWRTAIAAYLCMSTVSVSSRRPRPINMNESAVNTLATFSETCTTANDHLLSTWMQVQLVAEEIEDFRVTFHRIQPHIDVDCTASLESLEDRLESAYGRSGKIMALSLHTHYLWTRLRLNEIRLQHNNSACTGPVLTTDVVRAITSLVQDCHGLIDAVSSADSTVYLNGPTVTTVRALYAVKELLLLQKLINSDQGRYKALLSESVLKSWDYFERFKHFLTSVNAQTNHKVPAMAMKLMAKLELAKLASTDQLANVEDDLDGVTKSTLPDIETVNSSHTDMALTGGGLGPGVVDATDTLDDVDLSNNGLWPAPDLDFLMMPGLDFTDPLMWNS